MFDFFRAEAEKEHAEREQNKMAGLQVCIPDKETAKVKRDFDEEPYKKRNVVERFFCRLKDCLRITIRLNKLSSSVSGFGSLAIFLLSSRIRHWSFSTDPHIDKSTSTAEKKSRHV